MSFEEETEEATALRDANIDIMDISLTDVIAHDTFHAWVTKALRIVGRAAGVDMYGSGRIMED